MEKTSVTLSVPPDGTPVCDFCSDPRIVTDYDCSDYVIPVTGPDGKTMKLGSKGKWAACAQCAAIVDRGDQEALLQRSMECLFLKHPEWPREGYVIEGTIKFLQDLHEEFWRRKR